MPDKLAAMTKGGKPNVTIQDLKRQQVKAPRPLKGFEEGSRKL
jgi:invasion protein IalB